MRALEMTYKIGGAAQPQIRLETIGVFAAFCMALSLAGSAPSFALDSSSANHAPAKISPDSFTSAQEALRVGVDDLQNGDAQQSLRALTYAADGGELLARWKLGNLYATGELVPRNDVLAYKYFEQLVESYSEEDIDRRDRGAIANAFVSVGLYSLSGIPGAIKADPERALEMFQVAATDFGDPEAQYRLARMYLEGQAGLAKDNMRAARWLSLAAEKGHCGAQALLGHLLFNGEGVPHQRARGLMWLSVAVKNAKGATDGWIHELQAKDFGVASEDDREIATAYVNAREKRGDFPLASAVRAAKPVARAPGAMVVSVPAPAPDGQ